MESFSQRNNYIKTNVIFFYRFFKEFTMILLLIIKEFESDFFVLFGEQLSS